MVGFKPMAGRIPYKGHTLYSPAFDGQIGILPSVGSLANNVNDAALVFKALTNEKYYKELKLNEIDPYVRIRSFDEQ